MPVYNKLVRDRIPEVIESTGKKANFMTLNEADFAQQAKEKLKEEVEEYFNAESDRDSIEELADIMELLHSLAGIHGATPEELEKVRVRKAKNRGAFNKWLFLKEVEDE
ncbi:nucleoside triphosphate pyrophosphohydrolase [Alteribacter populi]|uniref:nucleoside triphosphate pyrophosphohydrolase n=1 Tax=Alteribacter populi TaxID=2011011 RepID=UPI000BBAB17C|nr:nucleoside triphosphate pyrophosphohydrolase [Alteribacter populi]